MHLVNANNTSIRTAEQLRIKYENLKAKARKVAAQQKCALTGTGGGPGQRDVLNPVLEAILEIVNRKTVVGLDSPWDSDRVTGQLKTQCDEEKENQIPDIHLTLPGQEIVDILVVDEVPQTCPRPDDCIEEQAITDTPSTSKNTGAICHTAEEDKDVDNPDVPSVSKTWESYTPQHLRSPMSKKLRLNRGHTKSLKDKFYEKKLCSQKKKLKGAS
ncbi:unnamed protein product [Callosobruchus maculatus]|uniref:Nuclear apoptosis-inducing factor 1 n=1 Tax=Callosobruchus maculatus TaxID=64391 RepID=A0A653BW21_CALMS|nr:unnamed protein product [Callosobruchus maculatus]